MWKKSLVSSTSMLLLLILSSCALRSIHRNQPADASSGTPNISDAAYEGTNDFLTITNIGTIKSTDSISAVTTQSDGKVIAVGTSDSADSAMNSFVVVRYNVDGSLDTSFGTNGKVTTVPIGPSNEGYPNAVAIQSNGKIVVVGTVGVDDTRDSNHEYFAVIRYNANGVLDNSFGNGGIVLTNTGLILNEQSSWDIASSVAIQSDGKIVVAGHSNYNMQDIAIVKYNSNGTLDTGFGVAGIVLTNVGARLSEWRTYDDAYSVAIQSDGKIVIAGQSGFASDFLVIRYYADGQLDNGSEGGSGFGAGGILRTNIRASLVGDFVSGDYAYSVAIQDSDQKIVVAGASNAYDAAMDFAVIRYNPDGSRDSGFGTSGIAVNDLGGNSQDTAKYVSIQNSNGKILVAGDSYDNSGNVSAVARYSSNGTIDNSFATGGILRSDFASHIVIQGDNKILFAGISKESDVDGDFALVRYTAEGALDSSNFGTNGKVITNIGEYPTMDRASSTAIQHDGKMILAGSTASSSGSGPSNFVIIRYNANGDVDTSFGDKGNVITDITGDDDFPHSLVIQSDGKILVAGNSMNSIGGDQHWDMIVVRYNSDGTLDSSFATAGKFRFNPSDNNSQVGVSSILLQSDGKIILAGRVNVNDGEGNYYSSFTVVRLRANGTLDTSFGTGGIAYTNTGEELNGVYDSDFLSSAAIQKDGKIVVVGASSGLNPDTSSYSYFTIARYLSDGTLDLDFGTDGIVTTNASVWDQANSVAIQSDGKIVIAGSSESNAAAGGQYQYFAVARYLSNGTLDTGFGDNGIATTLVNEDGYSYAGSVTIQSDGKIVAAGEVSGYDDQDKRYDRFAIVKYTSDGNLDGDFGTDGVFSPNIRVNVPTNFASHIFAQSNGKLVVTGNSCYSKIACSIVLTRF